MSYRILLPILTYPDPTPESGFARALDLAATLDASVTALVHEVDIPPITDPFADLLIDVKGMSAAAEALSRSRAEQLTEAIKRQAERIALPLSVERLRAERLSGERIAAVARTYDLTLLLSEPDSPDHVLLSEEVLFRSGGPAIVMIAATETAHLNCVAIAWDGSRAAARALRDALPVLAHAGRVVVLTASDDKAVPAETVAAVVAFLAGHNVAAEHRPLTLGEADIGEALQFAALAEDAGLLVMGAYGHSRMREFVLGGATKSVLKSPKLPILMSH